jgi:hypothetical protein
MPVIDGPEKYMQPTFLGEEADSDRIPDLELDTRLELEKMVKQGSFKDNGSKIYLFPQESQSGVAREIPGRLVLENIRRTNPLVDGGKVLQVLADLWFVSGPKVANLDLRVKDAEVTLGDAGEFFYMIAGEGMLPDGKSYRFLAVRSTKS